MKAILRQYLAELRERDELDKILPDILSERGHIVLSRPSLGFGQYGVDVTTVGPHPETGEKTYFILSIKSGDLTRPEWNTGDQALRPSLDDIRDVHYQSLIPLAYKDLPVVIALCFGGDIRENVRERVNGYIKNHTDPGKLDFVIWNGDSIADLILSGLMDEAVFTDNIRRPFRKALAFVDEPDVCERHFLKFATDLLADDFDKQSQRLRALRQVFLALVTIIGACREADNFEAACRCADIALLWSWDTMKDTAFKSSAPSKAIRDILARFAELQMLVIGAWTERHVRPYLAIEDALGISVMSREMVDINLHIFKALGRLALFGHWALLVRYNRGELPEERAAGLDTLIEQCVTDIDNMIARNAVLQEPIRDDHAIEITLAAQFLRLAGGEDTARVWVTNTTNTVLFALRPGGRYPCIHREYSDLIKHPEPGEAYFQTTTAASLMLPTLAVWLAAFREDEVLSILQAVCAERIPHCNFQLWLPNANTEARLYRGGDMHGIAWSDFDITGSAEEIVNRVEAGFNKHKAFWGLSTIQHDLFPIFATACLRHRIPLPPHVWSMVPVLGVHAGGSSDPDGHDNQECAKDLDAAAGLNAGMAK